MLRAAVVRDWLRKRMDLNSWFNKSTCSAEVHGRILDPEMNYCSNHTLYTIMQKTGETRGSTLLVVHRRQRLSREGKLSLLTTGLKQFSINRNSSTGSKWNLPNASSHWRKADEPQQALQVMNNLDIAKIPENKLKSALLTNRGGPCLDIEHWSRQCGKAMKTQ